MDNTLYREINFDGLVGSTHNYAGLSFGNIASSTYSKQQSNPKLAALQGLHKMHSLMQLGIKQAVLPPHFRPDFNVLRQLGFDGTPVQIIDKMYRQAPILLANMYSASNMWTANAATVSPSCDSLDGQVHMTSANLVNKLHRSIESDFTKKVLQHIFYGDCFSHHEPLFQHDALGDEGAANHTRLCNDYGQKGLQLFVYGQEYLNHNSMRPAIYPARQTLEASCAVARLHQLSLNDVMFIQQNPDMIDAGVFHNDVIAVGNKNVLFYYQDAFVHTDAVIERIASHSAVSGFHPIMVNCDDISIDDVVSSYLFNSQLISLDDGSMCLIAPSDCQNNDVVAQYLRQLAESDPYIKQIKYFDLRESMKNGGGPACLRLRVVLSELECQNMNTNVFLTEDNYPLLVNWVERYYRDSVVFDDLRDIHLLEESYQAYDELTKILALGNIYAFQQ